MRVTGEPDPRVYVQAMHQSLTISFDGLRLQPELAGNLVVRSPPSDVGQDFSLSRSQRVLDA